MANYRLLHSVIHLLMACAISCQVLAGESDPVDGSELYHDYCSVCHGDKGDGNSRAKQGLVTQPRDFTQPGLDRVLSRDRMVDAVLHGRPGTAMVGWATRLNRQQAEVIVDYIRNTFMSGHSAARKEGTHANLHPVYMEQPFMFGLTGNDVSGRKFYEDNCATCHGIKGDGNGPRAYFIFPKPRNFLIEKSRIRLNRPALFNAIKFGIRGREMPAWGKVISDQQIANVAEYVFNTMIHPEENQ